MKLKKIMSGALALVMVTGIVTLASCGKDASTSQTAKEGTLVVGLDDTFAPMGFRDESGNLVGFDVEFAEAVGKELGVKVEFKPIAWEAKDLELTSKNIDCIWNGMSVTEDRKEAMALSNKYLDNKIILMTQKSKTDVKIESAEDLAKYKIGTQAGSAALEMLTSSDEYDSFKKNILEYPDYDKAILDLKAGRVDVIAIDQTLGEYKNNNLNGELSVCEYSLGTDAYAIGFRKDDKELRDSVNDAIKKLIDDGTAEKISKKWFGKNIVIFDEI